MLTAGHHALPAARTSSPPLAAYTPPAATPAAAGKQGSNGHVPIATMPTLPASLNTPMAQMQQLPMEMAVRASVLIRLAEYASVPMEMAVRACVTRQMAMHGGLHRL